MHEKEFDVWGSKKKMIHEKTEIPEFSTQEVWCCSVGVNIGFEADGKNDAFERPVCVFRKFNKEVFFGIPLTTKAKENKHHFRCRVNDTDGAIVLSQGRLLSARRLVRRIGKLSDAEFASLSDSFVTLLTEKPPVRTLH